MKDFNPYDAPSAEPVFALNLGDTSPFRIEDGCLVVPIGSTLPDICVYTGQEGGNIPIQKTFVWARSWIYLLILLNILILLIVYMIVRKKGRVTFFVSPQASSSRMQWLAINWAIFLTGLVALGVAIAYEAPVLGIACPVLVITSLVIYYLKVRGIYPAWIDETRIALKGIPGEVMHRMVNAESKGVILLD